MRILKWVGLGLGGVLALIAVAVLVLSLLGAMRFNQTYEFQVESIRAPTDSGSIARGRHIVEAIGACQDCHGENLAGQVLGDDAFLRFAPSNLTSGQGGIGGTFTDADYVRAIRHGVGRDGKALIIMPSEAYYYLSDTDLGSLIAYLKTLPPVDNQQPSTEIGPIGRIFAGLGQLPPEFLPASTIDHSAQRPSSPSPGVTAAYGEYLGHSCSACHGPGLTGMPAGDPESLPAPNLTQATADWSEADFIRTLRTGTTPAGRALDPDEMPWRRFGKMTDDELRAIWLFVKAQPVR